VFILLFVLCIVAAGAAGFLGGYMANRLMPVVVPEVLPQPVVQAPELVHPTETPISSPQPTPSPSVVDTADALWGLLYEKPQMSTAEVAAAVRNSVVEIKTETVTARGTRGGEGAGSGVIISTEGIVITNDHVINDAVSISVRLADGREFEAELVGTDPRTDIAVLRISASDLTPAVFGDSSEIVVGEGALAVGNPLGELGGTVTGGIISALDRDLVVDGQIMTLLQTDAAVNPGNSGGGLFNMNAELIGIVVAKSSGMDIEGLGFAIPSKTAGAVLSDIMEYGFVRGRVDAGLELVSIQTNQAARNYRVNQFGLYILSSVNEQLLRGDRIIAIDGREISSQVGYDAAMRRYSIGDVVRITVMRGSQSHIAEVTLSEWRPG